MEENKVKRISLSTFLLIIAIIVIIIMAYFLYKINNERIVKTEEVISLQNEVSNLESKVNSLNEKINNNSNTNNDNINYIEMTEANYQTYNSNGYRFEISDMISNTDSTVTIKGRVYKLKDLPTLSQKQYQDLLEGKTITLMDYEMKISEDENGKDSGHDFLIESTGDWIKFYVDQNSDGTGKLSDYTEAALYESTDIYMQITVDNSISTKSGYGDISLKQYLNNWIGKKELKDTELLPGYNTEFIFENGKCSSILFTSV